MGLGLTRAGPGKICNSFTKNDHVRSRIPLISCISLTNA